MNIQDIYLDEYSKWVQEKIKDGTATTEENVETEVYVIGKNNSEVVKKQKRIVDIITIKRGDFGE